MNASLQSLYPSGLCLFIVNNVRFRPILYGVRADSHYALLSELKVEMIAASAESAICDIYGGLAVSS